MSTRECLALTVLSLNLGASAEVAGHDAIPLAPPIDLGHEANPSATPEVQVPPVEAARV